MGIGDWGLGIGDWGLGPIPNPQSPIPNPQSPTKYFFNKFSFKITKNINIKQYFVDLKFIKQYFQSNDINIKEK